MATGFHCVLCGSREAATLNTYKHWWRACAHCGTMFRERKERYAATRVMPSFVADWFGSTNTRGARSLGGLLFARSDVIDDPESAYAYYEANLRAGMANTKYQGDYARLVGRLGELDIPVEGKFIVDVSGGPGFHAKELSARARRVLMTEFDSNIVEKARSILGIETARFDFNADDLAAIVDEPADIVLVRYAINFCTDLPRFVDSLRKVCAPGATVYVSFMPPTLGVCLRCQFEDHAYLVFYEPAALEAQFTERGFVVIGRADDGSYAYDLGAPRMVSVLHRPYEIAGSFAGAINREKVVKNLVRTFRLPR